MQCSVQDNSIHGQWHIVADLGYWVWTIVSASQFLGPRGFFAGLVQEQLDLYPRIQQHQKDDDETILGQYNLRSILILSTKQLKTRDAIKNNVNQ